MDYSKIASGAAAMAAKAKDGELTVDGVTYSLTFDHQAWVYRVTDGERHFITLNTKKLSKAKQLLKEYLAS